jgi:hypothetical protein
LASCGSVDKPKELADWPDPRSRHLTTALADRSENRRLFLAGHQKRDTPAALEHGVGHGDADLGPSVSNSGHPAFTLA